MHSGIRIALVGDLTDQQKSYAAISKALAAVPDDGAAGEWVATDSIAKGEELAGFDGIWCVPGMPYRSADGALKAIRYARTTRTPFLGTSAGFQYALIEYARNVLGFSQADHQKSHPDSAMPLISQLGCALVGVKGRVHFTNGSLIRKAYGMPESVEHYYCSFGLNGRYRRLLDGGHLCVAAVDDQQEIRAVELEAHPFFVATLFQPEMGAIPSPLVNAFAGACARHRRGAVKAAS